MEVRSLDIPEVKLITQPAFPDERGKFVNVWSEELSRALGVDFVQWSMSHSKKGVLRGLHLQNPHAQDKLISVVSGSVFDVAVDVRKGSPTFGRWVSHTLRSAAHEQLFIPRGFAHGFQAL